MLPQLGKEATLLLGKRVLVTGADGFIGSHLTEALVSAGIQVRAFVLYNSFNSWGWLDSLSPSIRKDIDVFAGDVRDRGGVRQAMQGCDIVLHLAALISIPYSYHSPEAFVDTNVKGTMNILEAARDVGVSRVVTTSTSEVYGTAQFVPITEQHPLRAQSPYSATKISADQLALSFFRSHGTPVVVLRPFNTFGPRQSARAVIPTIITQLVSGQRKLKLGALHPTRDFSYVSDTARAFLHAAVAPGALGEEVNVGSGFEVTIGDVARMVAELMGIDMEIEGDTERLRPAASEVERLFAGIDKAERIMDWRPQYGGREGFKRGLAKTISWFSDPANLRGYKTDRYNI